ncbi:MAG: sugar phosphate isomerase/epimerase [Victivallales bacterium]|jgi:sugar phosphate isomerase/epimerase|nr:sugar phosphate isomerase/epimerase [Victivallales bacterium]
MNFNLSYQINTVLWNGTEITKRNDDVFLSNLDILLQCGIREVMLSGYTDAEKSAFDMLKETARIGKILRSRGMKAAQHHGVAPIYASLSYDQKEVREKLKRSVDYTANLNADVLVIHPGHIDKHFNTTEEYIRAYENEVKKHGQDALIDANAENLNAAGQYAEQSGVKIALENMDRFVPMANIEILPELIKKSDSPAVGFCIDSGHAHCCGKTTVVEWILRMREKVFTTHFHDNRGVRAQALGLESYIVPPGIDEHLPPGFGTIPWVDVIQSLRKIGYRHTVNFESGPWPGMSTQAGYEAAINFWRTCEYYAELKERM